ncbi:MAG: S41 family peptidase [Blastocatellia bacterium]
MMRSLLTLMFLVISHAICIAQTPAPMPFQTPSVSRTQIVFVYAGEIWIVDRQGGEARKFLNQAGEKSSPCFSPDGSQIAFSMSVNDNLDIYVAPVAGGEPKRLTWHPKDDYALGWTPDGKNVLFRSHRIFDAMARLFTISAQGGFETELPLPMGWDGSFSPDGARLAYMPLRDATGTWRNYRGGQTAPLWIATLTDSQIESLPRDDSNNRDPMWIGATIYFVSDRSGTANLFGFDTKTKKIAQLTRFEKYDIKSASAGGGAIVLTQDGSIHLFDLKSNQSRVVPVRLNHDSAETKPRTVKVSRHIRDFDISPSGTHALLAARGEVLTVSADKSETRNLTNTTGAAERRAAWSPDGKWIAYFSDESGEYQLHLRPADGAEGGRKIAVEKNPSFYGPIAWSPDAKQLAFYDKRSALWIVNIDGGAARRIDNSIHPEPEPLYASWSPDSRWLAYQKNLPNRLKAVFLHSLETGKGYQVSDSRYDAASPAFDASGKYLYFTASANAGTRRAFGMSAFAFRTLVTRNVMAAVLSKDGQSPLVAPAQENGKIEDGSMKVDPEGVAERAVRLPLPTRDYVAIAAGRAGVLFVLEARADSPPLLHKFDVASRKQEKFIEGVFAFLVSADRGKLLCSFSTLPGQLAIVGADAPPKAGEGRLNLSSFEIQVAPRDEWKQIYREAWRLMRDYFYDPNHHGQDLAALEKHYAAYLPNVVTRDDLNYVLREMFSHITVSHIGVGGGDSPQPRPGNVGLLGADYEINQGRYRITRIYRGDSSDPLLTSPLTQPGVSVKAGDYLLAVDGQEINAPENLFSYFQGKAGRPAQIKVGANPNGDGARVFTVTPLPGENTLRLMDWAENNRRKIAEMSGGKLAYIFLPDTGQRGYSLFQRDFYAQFDKQGVIIDERFNSGGAPADYFIESLKRAPLSYYAFREGEDMPFPVATIPGPRVMITNEFAGSGGDTLPWMFRQAGIGTLVGKRTWGGGIGGYINLPDFVDGGGMAAPNRGFFNPRKGVWDIENNGVAPDIEVEFDPAAARAGRDPQLERAVQIALEELKKNPPTPPKRPKYPAYK